MKRIVSDATSEKLTSELQNLEMLDDDVLKRRWGLLYGTNPLQKIHRSLLIAGVAHRL